MKMNYDIFISCKSEDYPVARKVYQYLRDQKYSVFLADTELRKKGNAEYGKIIDEALDYATHMIIIASKSEFIRSPYVQSEWRTFIEEKRTGRKTGNIITIIDGFQINSLPISLRQFESFDFNSYTEICAYLPLEKQNGEILLDNSKIKGSKSNAFKNLSKNKGCVITITIVFLLCIVCIPFNYLYFLNSPNDDIVDNNKSPMAYKSPNGSKQSEINNHLWRNGTYKGRTKSKSNYIQKLTTYGIFGKNEAEYTIIFNCQDDNDINIETKAQVTETNYITYFSMYLHKKHIEGTVNNENGKSIGYIDAEFSISENFFEIKGKSHIQENGDHKTIPFEVNGELPTHIINKIVQTNRTSFE